MDKPDKLQKIDRVTTQMVANIAQEQSKNKEVVGMILLCIDEDGSYLRTVSCGCYSKIISTVGALRYTAAIFERDCMDMSDD